MESTLLATVDPTAAPGGFLLAVVLAAFVSEDLTVVGVGLLIADGRAGLGLGLLGAFLGILLSDAAVWGLGRAGRRVAWVRRRIDRPALSRAGDWLDRRGWITVIASRFLPGTRVPLFLAAGLIGRRPVAFLLWGLTAALIWTPVAVLSVAYVGTAVGPLPMLIAVASGFVGVKLGLRLRTPVGRAKLVASASRLWRWEFWPAWVFYLPLVPWWVYLAVRYRSVTVWTCANPGIPAGGVVGESKADILRRLPAWAIIPSEVLPAGQGRLTALRQAVARRGWDFPLVLKPDAGQRGVGVKKIADWVEGEKYLQRTPGDVLVQPYHAGPVEAGVFYYRLPGEDRGHIFAVTDKVFPELVGDGRSTVEELIWKHSRYRMQARTFLMRHEAAADQVLGDGERFPLALAGNHCQGTLFRDGGHLVSPALADAVNVAATEFQGFHVGRFDVRASSVEALRRGEFAVVELNGVTAEATNVYDPSWPLWRAYLTLARQWALVFRIGDLNRRRGAEATSVLGLVKLVRDYYGERVVDVLAD
jgi:membrane protein DedA with SNARE-associated domain